MKFKIPWDVMKEKGRKLLGRYKYVLLLALVGVLLLLWPAGKDKGETTAQPSSGAAEVFTLEEMEARLSQTLSKVQGAGDVSVMLTLQSRQRQILASDEVSVLDADGSSRLERSTVILSGGTGAGETPVVLQEVMPSYQGALVVCEGGDNAKVKLKLLEAVAALTGLGTDKITICKGKG